jgi:translation elongation factor P/translation initiation factor 5A
MTDIICDKTLVTASYLLPLHRGQYVLVNDNYFRITGIVWGRDLCLTGIKLNGKIHTVHVPYNDQLHIIDEKIPQNCTRINIQKVKLNDCILLDGNPFKITSKPFIWRPGKHGNPKICFNVFNFLTNKKGFKQLATWNSILKFNIQTRKFHVVNINESSLYCLDEENKEHYIDIDNGENILNIQNKINDGKLIDVEIITVPVILAPFTKSSTKHLIKKIIETL